MTTQVSSHGEERKVLYLHPTGGETIIKRNAAIEMMKEGSVRYAGRVIDQFGMEREAVQMIPGSAMTWRKTTRTTRWGMKLGMAGMELVHL